MAAAYNRMKAASVAQRATWSVTYAPKPTGSVSENDLKGIVREALAEHDYNRVPRVMYRIPAMVFSHCSAGNNNAEEVKE